MSKILGLGNALVDILAILRSDEILDDLSLPKGSMQLVDTGVSNRISLKIKDNERFLVTGGSASNTVYGLAKLGVPVGFVGKVGRDEMGSFFSENSRKNGIKSFLLESETPSGVCISLVSPDGERTMATCLGAACEMAPFDLKEEMFKGYEICHIEGYWVQNKELIHTAMKMGKKFGLKISLDLASYNVVLDNLDFLKELTTNYVDILFANEEEARVFTGMENPEEALESMATFCDIAVVKLGAKGSLVKQGNSKYCIPAVNGVNCLDTTGAGDLYASGFLYGLIEKLPLHKCGEIGSIIAANVIEVVGTKIKEEKWIEIHSLIKG
jgi:sugar/nucleoside kinase (ribokinase family)